VDVIRGHRAIVERLPPPAVAIGMFDGVHRGHQELLRRAVAHARAHGGAGVALTFDPHPAVVLAPDAAPPMLASLDRRLDLLAAMGLDTVVVEPFTAELSRLDRDAFVDQILVGALGARHVVVGWNWRYGHARAGTIETLVAHGTRAGFTVDPVSAVIVDGAPVSSTRIRGLVRAGDLAAAERLLGRRYDVTGMVVAGAKRGREIGIPTANVAPEVPVLAPTGIYPVWLHTGGAALPGVASLGTNPTFVDGGAVTLEVHVLDWTGDLYDRRVRVELLGRLRGEEKYDTVEALVAQIRRDISDARSVLGNSPPGVSVS
jgi:riboflavin kinase/FMN adenylyltransferase